MKINRRSKYAIFINDDALWRMDECKNMGIWEFLQLFFPDDTNKKQFGVAHNSMRQLLKSKSLQSSDFKKILSNTEYHTFISVVLPKLERFGLVKVTGQRGRGKTYMVELDDKFFHRIRHLSMEWFRVYTKYGESYGG
jgi:hypothetical protein